MSPNEGNNRLDASTRLAGSLASHQHGKSRVRVGRTFRSSDGMSSVCPLEAHAFPCSITLPFARCRHPPPLRRILRRHDPPLCDGARVRRWVERGHDGDRHAEEHCLLRGEDVPQLRAALPRGLCGRARQALCDRVSTRQQGRSDCQADAVGPVRTCERPRSGTLQSSLDSH